MHQAQDDNLWYVYFQTLNKNQFSIYRDHPFT